MYFDQVLQSLLYKIFDVGMKGGKQRHDLIVHYGWIIRLRSLPNIPILVGIHYTQGNTKVSRKLGALISHKTQIDYEKATEAGAITPFIPPVIDLNDNDAIGDLLYSFPMISTSDDDLSRGDPGMSYNLAVFAPNLLTEVYVMGDSTVEAHKIFWKHIWQTYRSYLHTYNQQGIYIDEFPID
ncbi:MAG: hypothetical protein RLP44_26540 [Aggregatilineales bacterium]